ncbi:hypothetical protein [Streptomyces sp. CB03238]|uniref:hypothetical protein n=1 Tax=Streptomyces sp. CB03238 TaxID=1907777 RepID=UPI000A123055|nr:hypothetical protein [Streptomyces sp. CB03238]ORT61255.1 hypothetical protein BKD26_04065 [Streptomyces sp. CB03238]
MPVIADPSAVPLTPVVTILLSADGSVSVNGEVLPTEGDPRVAGLAEVRIKAAFLGRPVRVIAKEPDGSVWALIVDVDGAVTPLAEPHPHPQPEGEAPAPEAVTGAPGAVTGVPGAGAPAATRSSARPAADWEAPLPAEYSPLWDRIRAAEQQGDLRSAAALVAELVGVLTQRQGPDHPLTLNAQLTEAYFALLGRDHPRAALLYAHTARRMATAGAPHESVQKAARNAYASWKEVADPLAALEVGRQVLAMWHEAAGEDRRPIAWTERRLRALSARIEHHTTDASP